MSRAASVFRAASLVARNAPGPVVNGLARVLGQSVALAPSDRRLLVERNMRRADPSLSGRRLRATVHRCFESYARYWAESFRLPTLTPAELDAGVTYEGYEHYEEAMAGGIGPILAMPHLGGWEWVGFWFTQVIGHPVTVVVERLEPDDVFEFFVEFRRALGMNVVPLGPDAGRAVIAAVKRREPVVLLSDRDIGGGGVEVEFFGERTTLPAGPATLALRTGAPLLPIATYYRGRSHHAVVKPPMAVERRATLREDIARITQDIAHEMEALIRVAPDQWHLMSPNWPSDLEAIAAARRS